MNRSEVIDTLPDTLSGLLTVAIQDMRQVIKDPRYAIHTGTYHESYEIVGGPTVCLVCLAGTVIAKTLGASPSEHAHPYEYRPSISRKLRAVDAIRVGDIQHAYALLTEGSRGRIDSGVENLWIMKHSTYLSHSHFLSHFLKTFGFDVPYILDELELRADFLRAWNL